jgi:SAM-dependent methyltransferase
MNQQKKSLSSNKSLLKHFLEWLFDLESSVAKHWVAASHKRLMYAQWGIQPTPEWFDHSIDLYYQWSKTKNSLWLERGVFGGLALKGGRLLELSCGDGFNAKHFYALRSTEVVACDYDYEAIAVARKKNSADNITFVLADIRDNMPTGKFENIVWDAAIAHFKPKEIKLIMANIKDRLTSDGVLSGYTIVERGDGKKHLHQHEYEFKDVDDLKNFFVPHFKNIRVFETIYPGRHNLYFWASDSTIPFDYDWGGATWSQSN